jgi:7-cyano-7-deazaguanine synthase in queuosine biosynthesis
MVKKVSDKDFKKLIKSRKYEDLTAIQTVEKFFLKKRGYIFKVPKPGTPVVLLVSGGIDSTVAWHYLTFVKKLDVYPVYLHRGTKRWKKEKKAVDYFTKFYREIFPKDRFHEPREYSTTLPTKEMESLSKNMEKVIHPSFLLEGLENEEKGKGISSVDIFGTTPYLFAFFGANYAKELFYTKKLNIKHVFCTVAVGDGRAVPSQTFTALRSTMFSICSALAEWDWNFASIAFEKEMNSLMTKADLIAYGMKNKIPLGKTWSCYRNGVYQCGNKCLTCESRQQEFLVSGYADPTKYFTKTLIYRVGKRIKSFLKNS